MQQKKIHNLIVLLRSLYCWNRNSPADLSNHCGCQPKIPANLKKFFHWFSENTTFLQPNLDACLCPEDNSALGGLQLKLLKLKLWGLIWPQDATGPNRFLKGLRRQTLSWHTFFHTPKKWVPHWSSPLFCLPSLGSEVSKEACGKGMHRFCVIFSQISECRVLEGRVAKCFLVRPHVSAQPSPASSLSQGLTVKCLVTAALGHTWPCVCVFLFGQFEGFFSLG